MVHKVSEVVFVISSVIVVTSEANMFWEIRLFSFSPRAKREFCFSGLHMSKRKQTRGFFICGLGRVMYVSTGKQRHVWQTTM